MVVSHKQAFLMGVLVDTAVPMGCEISFDELKKRLEGAGLGEYAPKPRARPDAIRVAITKIVDSFPKKGIKIEDNKYRKIDITEIPKERGKADDDQCWNVKWKYIDAKGKDVAHELVGTIVLKADGTLTTPGELSAFWDLSTMTAHYMVTAEHTKLRAALDGPQGTITSVSKPLAIRWGKFLPQDRIEFLEQKIAPCFENLDVGVITIDTLEIANTPKNVSAIQNQIEESAGSLIDKILVGIVEARDAKGEGLTKGVIRGWLDTIENLRSNMALMGILDVKLPASLDDMEMKVAALKAEWEAEKKAVKKGRVIHSMAAKPVAVEDEDEESCLIESTT